MDPNVNADEYRGALQIRVVSEQQCIPELHPWRFKRFARERVGSFSGWTKQQVCGLLLLRIFGTGRHLTYDHPCGAVIC